MEPSAVIVRRFPIRSLLLFFAVSAPAQTPGPGGDTAPAPLRTPPLQTDPAIPPTAAHHRTPRPPRSAQSLLNPNVVVLDPAHGGADPGARLGENSFEKEATLAFSNRLKSLLIAQGFSVVQTRGVDPVRHADPESDGDTPPPPVVAPNLSLEARVEQSNRSHAGACLILHAANGGHGVHFFTSAITPTPPVDPNGDPPIRLWDTAQAAAVAQSQRLASDLTTAFNGTRIPLVTARASIRPIDSLNCPAIVVEIAPLPPTVGAGSSPVDSGYQQRVAEAVTRGLVSWRSHAQPGAPPTSSGAKGQPGVPNPPAPKPTPKIRTRPVTPPIETPAETSPAPAPSVPPHSATPPPARNSPAPSPAPQAPGARP